MNASHIAIAVLLAVAAFTALLAVIGVAFMPGVHEQLHYLAPVSVIGAAAVAAAVIIQQILDTRGIKALLVFGMLAGLNPLLVHATSRAARVRDRGDWRQDQ